MKLNNASAAGQVYYGLHMVPGVAEYKNVAQDRNEPLRIFIGEQAIKNMDASFAGRPLFVSHVGEVNEDTVRNEADGWVVDSFYNKADGMHWCKFIALSDDAKSKISQGWKLSNSYFMRQMTGGGKWHGVEYSKEVLAGEYEHLALVPNPRYEESIILTPEEFKAYNSDREDHLIKIANSAPVEKKKEKKGMFNIFKKEKVDNSADLEQMSVVLPRSNKEVELKTLIQNADQAMMDMSKPKVANTDDLVVIGDDQMSIKDLTEKYLQLSNNQAAPQPNLKDPRNPMNAEDEDDEEKKKKDPKKPDNSDDADKDAKKADEKKPENESDDDKDKKDEKANNSHGNLLALKNAADASRGADKVWDSRESQVNRGKARYGSK